MDLLRLHQEEMDELKVEKMQLVLRISELEEASRLANDVSKSRMLKLQDELEMKCDIIRRFDPSSDAFSEQRNQIEEQKERIRELSELLEAAKASEQDKIVKLCEKIELLEEQNKILTCIVDERKKEGKMVDDSVVDDDASEKEFYRSKYQEIDLKYGMLVAQNDTEKRRLHVENIKLKQQLK